ncbi:hypothetical protein FXO38_16015 [Capsicum annuum]|nr:hypothetical protein FXO37_33347 [Capsicum annuum]KAF3652585.1 hypothetical protein FXO38_16015 [Capsicum annuum]
MSFSDFKMVENEKYEFFSWGKVSFFRLMASLRQEFSMEKQFYRLGGIPQVFNVWMFELCSNVDTKVAVKEGPTGIDSLVKEADKSVEIDEDKANKATSPFKDGEQHEKDDEIGKLSDIVVEEMQLLDSIISDKAYVNYYNADVAKNLATQDASVKTDIVADMEMSLINTINRLSMRAGQPWHMANEVFVPINCDGVCHWHKVPINWAVLKSYKGKTERDPFQVEYVSEIAQQDSVILDCGMFVAVYAEYLSEGLDISYSGIDAQYHRLKYATLLCKYGSEKIENDYFSENGDPPRPRSKFAPKEIDRVLHIK